MAAPPAPAEPAAANTGMESAFEEIPSGGETAANPTRLEAVRAGMLRSVSSIRERAGQAATATGAAVTGATRAVRQKDWSRESEALAKVKLGALGAAEGMKRVYSGALRKVFGGPLAGIAKGESNTRPCPRLMLVCCTAIVSGALAVEGIFREHGTDDEDELYCLYGAFENASGLVLPPADTNAHVLAAVIKKFLVTLPEPVLTFRMLPEFMAAAAREPHEALALLPRLPQVNFNTLHILMDCLARVAEFSEHNGMDAAALAAALAPCVAWHPAPKTKQGGWPFGAGGSGGGGGDEEEGVMEVDGYEVSPRVELSPEELAHVTALLRYLIADFRTWNEGIVFT